MTEEEYLQLIEGKLEAAIENIKDEMKLNDKDIAQLRSYTGRTTVISMSMAMRSTRTDSRCSIMPILEAEI